MALFMQELHGTVEHPEILKEDFEDTMTSFLTMATRKLKGYSVGEIDHLAKKARAVNSEVGKRDLLERINDALNDARKALKGAKADKQKELRTQIQVLGELKAKVSAFSVTGDAKEKEDDDKNKEIIDLDAR